MGPSHSYNMIESDKSFSKLSSYTTLVAVDKSKTPPPPPGFGVLIQ